MIAEVMSKHKKSGVGKTTMEYYYLDIEFRIGNKPIKTFIDIEKEQFEKTKTGSKLEIVYLPDNPNRARLKSFVDNYDNSFAYKLSLILFVSVFFYYL
ncbi:MAG: DUF3592 domain-containing protein [Bacteroidales bacterium]|nr:DUF3592 domain-containing protein [Bacteroidales bacterium]